MRNSTAERADNSFNSKALPLILAVLGLALSRRADYCIYPMAVFMHVKALTGSYPKLPRGQSSEKVDQ